MAEKYGKNTYMEMYGIYIFIYVWLMYMYIIIIINIYIYSIYD